MADHGHGRGQPERQHPRYATDIDVVCDHPKGTLAGRTKNLSRGGLCMLGSAGLAAGTPVTLRMSLVFDENQRSESLQLDGRIAWCTPLGNAFQLGVQFVSANPEALSFLGLFMQLVQDADSDDAGKANDGFTSTTTFHSEDHES